MSEEGLEIISLMSEFSRDFGQSLMKDLQNEDSDDLCVCQAALVLSDSLQPYGPQSGSSVHGYSPGRNTRVGCHGLLQGIFLTQGLNPCLLCLLHWQVGSLPLEPPGKPLKEHSHLQTCSSLEVLFWLWHVIVVSTRDRNCMPCLTTSATWEAQWCLNNKIWSLAQDSFWA